MKGVKTKIVLAPFKAWFTFGESLAREWENFTLTSTSWVAYTGDKEVVALKLLAAGTYYGYKRVPFWGDPQPYISKAYYSVAVSDKAVDGAVAYISDDLKLWRKAPE